MAQELPENWSEIVLGQICRIRNGYAFKSKDFQSQGIPLVRQSNLTGKDVDLSKAVFLPNSYLEEHKGYAINKGDIVLGMSGSIGEPSTYKYDYPALQNQRTGLLQPFSDIDIGFVRFFLESSHSLMMAKSKGMAVQNISAKDIEELSLGLPPVNEQKRIVDRIEQLFSDMGKGEELLKTVQKQLATYRQSVLKAAVTGELIGVKTGKWKEYNVGQLLTDIRYGTAKKCAFNPSKTPVLRIPNVAGGKIDLTDLKHTDFTEAELKKLRLEAGDILIVRSNGSVSLVGLSALVTESAVGFAYAGYLIRLRLKKDIILPEFLNLYLHSPIVRNKIELHARSTSGVHNVNSDEIKAIALNVPSIKEQELIVDKVEEAFSQIAALEEWCAAGLKRSATLRQSILKSAFSGKLVAQDPADEPASELLARIKSGVSPKTEAKAATSRRGRKPRSDKSEAA